MDSNQNKIQQELQEQLNDFQQKDQNTERQDINHENQQFYQQSISQQIQEFESHLKRQNTIKQTNFNKTNTLEGQQIINNESNNGTKDQILSREMERKMEEKKKEEEDFLRREEQYKLNINNFLSSKYASKAKPNFIKDFNEAMTQGYSQDLKLATMLDKLRNSKKLWQIIQITGSIFVPMLITGMENFKSTMDIKTCVDDNGKQRSLSTCVWCNGQSSTYYVGPFYTIMVYLIWFLMGNLCVYIFIVNLRYTRIMNAMNPYGVKVVGTFLNSLKSHKFQFSTVFLSIIIGTLSTRIFRNIVISFEREVNCSYREEEGGDLIPLALYLELTGNSFSIFQFLLAMIISGVFYIRAFILIFDKSASPISMLVTSSELFNREYDENLEYLTYRLRGITKQINIRNFFQECNQTVEDSGYSKFQIVFIKSELLDAIILVMMFRIEQRRVYEQIDKFALE